MVCCADNPVYSRLDVVVGQSVELQCNTSRTSDIMWSLETLTHDDGYVDFIYWNGHIDSTRTRLSTKSIADGFHSLVIADAKLNDSGLYNCYDGKGLRKIGYQLIVKGIC